MSNHDMGKIDYYLRESHKERDCNGTLVNGSRKWNQYIHIHANVFTNN